MREFMDPEMELVEVDSDVITSSKKGWTACADGFDGLGDKEGQGGYGIGGPVTCSCDDLCKEEEDTWVPDFG